MADTGSPHNLPFPVATDPPAGHTQMQALAEQVAERLGHVALSSVATEEGRTNATYGLLATPDVVAFNVPTADHIVEFMAWAEVKESVADAARVQIQVGTAPGSSYASFSTPSGLNGSGVSVGSYGVAHSFLLSESVAQGMRFQLSANVSLMIAHRVRFTTAGDKQLWMNFSASSGTVTARNRKLWVRVVPF